MQISSRVAVKVSIGIEDAIQYYTALENKLSTIVTRNRKDFRTAAIPTCTAEEFLSQFTPQ